MTLDLSYFPDKYEVGGRLFRTDTGKFYKNDGTFAAPVWTEIGGAGVPAGSMSMFCGADAQIPADFLRCDGAAISETTYDVLFAAIGYEWGNPGGGNFNLPNFETSNRFPRGAENDTELGTSGGESSHVLITNELASHNHGVSDPGHSHSYTAPANAVSNGQFNNSLSNVTQGSTTGSSGTGISINNTGNAVAHENKPPFASVYMIIKT